MGAHELAATLAAITEHQERLRAFLGAYEPRALTQRPPSGEWSAIENVRHLILAAQLHLGPFVAGGLGFSSLGLPQGIHPDTNASTDVPAVFAEWDRVHASIHDRLDVSNPRVAVEVPRRGVRVLADQLPRFFRHQQAHGRLALRALSQVTGQPARLPRASSR
ncbi:MAG TPA: DinB family protein [Acidimicrobiales bacterium]|jgi:hypothetical protein|nr:DinB family protein [Acidimicrobiales bacterium]